MALPVACLHDTKVCVPCLQHVRSLGINGLDLPSFSALTVTVPGAPALWEDIIRKHGKLSLGQARHSNCLTFTPMHPLMSLSGHRFGACVDRPPPSSCAGTVKATLLL